MKDFFFSIIVPVYNVEQYIEEAIESIIGQSIGFSDNVQLVLVNDGSTDKSGDICKQYRNIYPDNIVYIEKENGGVSSARNEGLKRVCGKYVNFIDSDDMWQQDSLLSIHRFLKENPDIRVVFSGLKLTGRKEGDSYHMDYQSKKTRIINIHEVFDYPQLKVATSFIARELLTDRFDSDVKIGEDILYINKILLNECRFGLVSEAVYLYRKREDESSALDKASDDISYYTVTPEKVYRTLIDASIAKYGHVIPYIQYLLITDMQWRLKKAPSQVLSEEQKKNYRELLIDLLKYVSDDMIVAQRRMITKEKAYALKLKNGEEAYSRNTEAQEALARKTHMNCIVVEEQDGELLISGRSIEKFLGDGYSVYVLDNNNKRYDAAYDRYPVYDWTGVDDSIQMRVYRHTLRLPLKAGAEYRFFISNGNSFDVRMNKLSFGTFSKLNGEKESVFFAGDYHVRYIDNMIKVFKTGFIEEKRIAKRYCDYLKKAADEEITDIWKEAYGLKKKARKKPIWLISDRSNIAGDNGEALFTYLMRTDAPQTHDIYFILSEDSPDYQRMKQIGQILPFGSREYYVKRIAASMLISSHVDEWVVDPFGKNNKYFRNIMEAKYVFLQHGVTKDDVSSWLHYFKKHINIFITAAQPEYQSIIEGDYGYDDSVVKLTGFARYDKLKDDRKNIIAFAPTWRKHLATKAVTGSERGYSDEFIKSDYYKFYNTLINDERILEAMKRKGYIGRLYVHPAMSNQTIDFKGNDTVIVWEDKIDYPKVFSESALLITDYSSVAMDFAYLKKPVIYTQFDHDEFFGNHLYSKGYFDYETDGFGPVTKTYDTAVEAIVRSIETDCTEPEEYSERVDKFFAFTDKNNCERIYKELKKLEGEK